MLPNAVPRPFFARNPLRAALSCGLFLRMATASSPPVRTVTVSCTVRSGEDLLPELRQVVVDDGDGDESRVDHLEHVVVFEVVVRELHQHRRLALAPSACSLSASRLWWYVPPLRTNTSRPDRSATEAIVGAPGPVTTTSLTFLRVGLVKSTSFCLSGVMVTWATTASTLPSSSACASMLRGIGTKTTLTFMLPVLSFLFSSSSKSFPYS